MSATSDFPAGLLNIITGYTGELTPTLATHEDIDGLDLEGVSNDEAIELSALAAGSIKRVLRPTSIVGTRRRFGGCAPSWKPPRSGTRGQ